MLLFLQEGVGQLVAKGAVGDEDAAFGVFRQCTEVDPDAGSAGHLAEESRLNLGLWVTCTLYIKAGIRQSAFSRVGAIGVRYSRYIPALREKRWFTE